MLERFDPRFHNVVKARMALLNERKQAVPNLDQTWLKLDGSPFNVEVSAVPIYWDGHDERAGLLPVT